MAPKVVYLVLPMDKYKGKERILTTRHYYANCENADVVPISTCSHYSEYMRFTDSVFSSASVMLRTNGVLYSSVYGLDQRMIALIEIARQHGLPVTEQWTLHTNEAFVKVNNLVSKHYPLLGSVIDKQPEGSQFWQEYVDDLKCASEKIPNPLFINLYAAVTDFFEETYYKRIPFNPTEDISASFRLAWDFFVSYYRNKKMLPDGFMINSVAKTDLSRYLVQASVEFLEECMWDN